MKRYGIIFAFIICIINPAFAEWYEGGNLHRADVVQWQSASASNRLATAGDWAVTILGESKVRQIGMNGVRKYAQQLVNCVNKAISNGPSNLAVSEVAASCAILMGK